MGELKRMTTYKVVKYECFIAREWEEPGRCGNQESGVVGQRRDSEEIFTGAEG